MALDLTELLSRARNDATPGAELERIAGTLLASDRARARDPRDRVVLGAVASNPNAPPSLLFLLATNHAPEVASNPVLSLLLLENPSLLASAPPNGICALLAQPATPPDWFEAATRHPNPQVRRTIASSRRAPATALLYLAGDSADVVLSTLAANPSTPGVAIARIARNLADGPLSYTRLKLGQALAFNPSTPLSTLEVLAARPELLSSVVANPSLPLHFVEMFASSDNTEVRAALAARSDLPRRLALRFVADPAPAVRARLAMHLTDPGLLSRLSLSSEGLVLRALLDNPHTPAPILERLAHAPSSRHRTAARERLVKQGGVGALQSPQKRLSNLLAPCPLSDPPSGRTTRPRRQGVGWLLPANSPALPRLRPTKVWRNAPPSGRRAACVNRATTRRHPRQARRRSEGICVDPGDNSRAPASTGLRTKTSEPPYRHDSATFYLAREGW